MSAPLFSFDYAALVRGSLLGMVRGLIEQVAQEGFPGDHHFLLTFGTSDPGVVMSEHLRKRYPDEMSIVLQHQYWNLLTDANGFQVTLRFGGSPEPLTVPWLALRAFADPSAGFGLRLQATADPDSEALAPKRGDERPRPPADHETEASEPAPSAPSNVLAFGAHRRRDGDEA